MRRPYHPRAVVLDEVLFLTRAGASAAAIADQLGMDPAAVARSLGRSGRHDLARPFNALALARRKAAGYTPPTRTCVDCGCTINRKSTRCREHATAHRYAA